MLRFFNKIKLVWWLVGLFILLASSLLISYLNISLSLNNITLLVLPVIISVNQNESGRIRFLVIAAVLAILHLFTSLTVFIFLSVGFGVFGIIELLRGKINLLAVLALFLITPLTKYFFDVFGFPIRLKLSSLTGGILGFFAKESSVLGNNIFVNGEVYSVDAACMGLKLVITSLLFGLLMLSISEKKVKRKYSVKQLCLFLLLTILLILVNNFLRILLLIITGFPPNSIGHELIGIFSLICFVFLPLVYLTKKIKPSLIPSSKLNKVKKSHWSLILLVPTVLICLGFSPRKDIPLDEKLNAVEVKGLKKEVLPNHVLKLSNGWSKTFVKPIESFFSITHEPFICWRGTGYSIDKEQLIDFNGADICTAELIRDGELLHTAWYYTNQQHITTNQFDWRWDWINSKKKYYLVNVSASSQELMEEALIASLKLRW